MKILNPFVFLIILSIFWACESIPEDEIHPDEEKDKEDPVDQESITFLLDSTCINTGDIPFSLDLLSLSIPGEKLFLIKGQQRLVKINPDTSIIAGYYIQVEGQDEYYCVNSINGFLKLGISELVGFNATICAYNQNMTVLGCLDLPVEVEEESDIILCIDEIGDKVWDWKYSIFNDNLFDYPGFNPSRPRPITGYCRTSDGTIENELILEEEGWINFIHLIMKDENKSFEWITNSYTKHWDILTTDCNQVGYNIDTVDQFFEGSYVFDSNDQKLFLNFDTQHPENGEHDVYLSCNLMIITRKVPGVDGGDGGEYTMVFEKLIIE